MLPFGQELFDDSEDKFTLTLEDFIGEKCKKCKADSNRYYRVCPDCKLIPRNIRIRGVAHVHADYKPGELKVEAYQRPGPADFLKRNG